MTEVNTNIIIIKYFPIQDCIVTHHLYLQVHHFLVQRCLRPLNLLNPLEGNKQQNMSQHSTDYWIYIQLLLDGYHVWNHDIVSKPTFSANDKTVLAWMMATCSSFLKFYTEGKKNAWINIVYVLIIMILMLNEKMDYPVVSQDV